MNRRILIKICILLVVAFSVVGISRLWVVCPPGDICGLAGEKTAITGKVVSLASVRLEKTYVELETGLPKPGIIQVVFPHTRYNFQYGDELALKGKLKLPVADPEDNFSYPLYLAGRRIHSVMSFPVLVESKSAGKDGAGWYRGLLAIREKVRFIVNRYLREPESSIINAMIIGDQGGVPTGLRQKLSEVGIIHILSVSGAHVTLMIALITLMLSKLIKNRLVMLVAVILGVGIYLLLAGSPSCATRSAIMGLLVYLALLSGRTSGFGNALWFSAAILTCLNPAVIFADAGFELSFLAVIGMVYLFPIFDKLVTWGRMGFWWNGARIILLSIAISLTTTPLVYYYFGIISWISPLANLVLLPLFSLALPVGLTVVVLGLFNPFLAGAAGFSAHLLLRFIELLVDWMLKIPGSYTVGTVKPGWIIIFYAGLLLFTLISNIFVNKYWFPRRLKYLGSDRYLYPESKKRRLKISAAKIKSYLPDKDKFENKILVLWLCILGFLLSVSGYYLYCSGRPPRLVMLDVGQGDALMLDWPGYHWQILIDGGSGRLVLPELGQVLPFYDRRIETLVLTHPHQDHLEGLNSVIDRYQPPYQIVLPERPTVDSPDLYKILWRQIAEKHIQTVISRQGQKIVGSSGNSKMFELEFLTPFFDYARHRILDLNDQSAVIRMNYPRKILFMGDTSKKLERILLARMSHNLQADVLKIGHHGSATSTSDEFLEAVDPKTALISVGEKNSYGHPAKDTLEKLRIRNIKTCRTDEEGRIEITLGN